MKILFLSHEASRTGAPISLLTLLEWFKENTRHEAVIVLMRTGEVRLKYEKLYPTFVLPKKRTLNSTFNLLISWFEVMLGRERKVLTFKQVYKKFKPDIIYSNTIVPLKVLLDNKSIIKSKVVCHVREQRMNLEIMLGLTEFRKVMPIINHYFIVSDYSKSFFRTYFEIRSDLFTIAPGPIRLNNNPSHEIVSKHSRFTIVGAGTALWRKGVDLFLQTAYLYKKKYASNVQFVWFGKCNDRAKVEIEFEIRSLGLQDFVYFKGSAENLFHELRQGHLFFLPSREDPFPRVAIEASFAELPIISFKGLTGVDDYLKSQGGYFADYPDLNSIVDFIESCYNDEKGLCESGKISKRCALDYIDYSTTCEAIDKKIIEIVEKG